MPLSLYTLLQESAEKFTERPAVSLNGTVVSYSQLLDSVDRVADWLAGQDVGAGMRAAFAFHKSIDALVAMFACLRIGVTYVPLDPAWPAARVEQICQDAQISIWLGTKSPPIAGMQLALVSQPSGSGETSFEEIRLGSALSGQSRPSALGAEIANLLYTSGTTGGQKGVQITTLSLLHFSQWAVDTFGITADDRLANHAPYNFDLSTLDIFAAVRAGSCMCPVPERTKLLPYQTAKFMAEERISVWYSVPSALAMLLPKLAGHNLSRLRWVLFAGEEMPLPVLKQLTEALPHAKFANLYGPTETNVCTWHEVQPGDLEIDEPLSIGQPISDTRLWIKNEDGTSADGPGELWVAGPTVTAGYAGDRLLTEAKLVPAPDGQGWAYRTGDLVSRRTDGRLRFHGRIDRMIKRRGYRIEPGEIESALMKHVTIRECAVFAVRDAAGEQLIKACVVPVEGEELQPAALRTGCRGWLPDYMVPDIWDVLPQLPRTDRGKIDWKKL